MVDRWKINAGPVVSEQYDNEVIAINLDTGVYCSMVGDSAALWKLLAVDAPVAALVNHFAERHAADAGVIATAVEEFLRRLEAESLILPANVDAPPITPELPPNEPATSPFAGFELHVYTDMRDLLLLDPVHDVAESGWPAELPKSSS